MLRHVAERICANDADARDLVQDTFERATRKGIPDDIASTRAWLMRMMWNLFLDRCRRAARQPAPEHLDESAADAAAELPVIEPAWEAVTVDDIRDAAGELEPAFRDVYLAHSFEHCSYEAIAARLHIPRVTVGSRLSRARAKLRAILLGRLGRNRSNV